MYVKVFGEVDFGDFVIKNKYGLVEKCDFRVSYKLTLGMRFSEPARKMTQNGGRVVAIGSIFDMNMSFDVRNMEKMWTTELLVVGDLNLSNEWL